MAKTDTKTAVLDEQLRHPIQDDGELIPGLRLTPVSALPAKQQFYDRLVAAGWRYHYETAEWVDVHNVAVDGGLACGRFAWRPDLSEAWLQPPGRPATSDELLNRVPTVPEPIMRMTALEPREWWAAQLHAIAQSMEDAHGLDGLQADRTLFDAWEQIVRAIGILSREDH